MRSWYCWTSRFSFSSRSRTPTTVLQNMDANQPITRLQLSTWHLQQKWCVCAGMRADRSETDLAGCLGGTDTQKDGMFENESENTKKL